MRDAERKTPPSQRRGEPSLGWKWYFLLGYPDLWVFGIPGLITIVIIVVFGVPDEFRLAVFIVALIVVLMVGSAVAVYLFGRSFKRGRLTAKCSDERRK